VFREADLDFEIKARKPDKAGPRDIPVFPRVLKGVNLLRASLPRLGSILGARDRSADNVGLRLRNDRGFARLEIVRPIDIAD